MRSFCGIWMKKQVKAEERLTAAMLKAFEQDGRAEWLVVNRFAVAAMHDPVNGNEPEGAGCVSRRSICGCVERKV